MLEDLVVQRRRDTEAALRPIKRLLHNKRAEPERIIADGNIVQQLC